MIIQPESSKNISAKSISNDLIAKFPQKFVAVNQYGVDIPAIPLQRGTQRILVEVEIFDVESWPNRPQYNLRSACNFGTPVQIKGKTVYVLNVAWLLREKIISQAQRAGSKKDDTDIADITNLLDAVGDGESTCDTDDYTTALKALVEKRPDLKDELKRAINCSFVL